MNLSPQTKAWLLKGDPNQPDLDGLMAEMRRKLVEKLESSSLEALASHCDECREALRSLGGPGSGNFGHAGRPGEVGGSAPADGSSDPDPSVQHLVTFAEFQAEKNKWSELNNKLLPYLNRPSHPDARKAVREQKEIVKKIHRMVVNPGDLPAIGVPGGPKDLVVIGAGPGGLSASTGGGTEGLTTLVLDAQERTGGAAKDTSRIENYPGHEIGIKGKELLQGMHRQAERVGAEIRTGAKVTDIAYDPETDLKTITLSNGEMIEARAVVIATGTRQVAPPFEGGNRMILGNSEALAKAGAGKQVVVLGGSNGAAQAALEAATVAESVTIVARSPLAKSMSDYQLNQIANHPKIHVEYGLIDKYEGNLLKMQDGRQIVAEAGGVFYGGKPNTEFLPDSIKRHKGGLVDVSVELETSMPGVFAIGDVRRGTGNRVIAAAGDGQVAVKNVFGYFDTIRPKLEIQSQRRLKMKAAARLAAAGAYVPKKATAEDFEEWDRLVDLMAEYDEEHPFESELAEEEEEAEGARALGGPGSGNFGHEGRPGQVGGSGEGTGSDAKMGSFERFRADLFPHGFYKSGQLEQFKKDLFPHGFYKKGDLAKFRDELFPHGVLKKGDWEKFKADFKNSFFSHGPKLKGAEDFNHDYRTLGGPGSGNFGHAGRPGQVGGSGDSDNEDRSDRTQASGPGSGAEKITYTAEGVIKAQNLDVAKIDAAEKQIRAEAITANELKFSRELAIATVVAEDSVADGDTRAQHTNAMGEYAPERLKVHEETFKKFFEDHEKRFGSLPPMGLEHPTVTFMAGMPGAGKSTAAADLDASPNSITIDPDTMKKYMPEYRSGLGSNATARESGDIADKLMAIAVQKRMNIVIDGTMKTSGTKAEPTLGDGALGKMAAFKEAGYRVEARFVDVTVEESISSTTNRFHQQFTSAGFGRFVPIKFSRQLRDEKYGTAPRRSFELAKNTSYKNAPLIDAYTHHRGWTGDPKTSNFLMDTRGTVTKGGGHDR